MSKTEAEQYFKPGAQVEVCMDRKPFRDSWYVATIITPPTSTTTSPYNRVITTTTVEYENLTETSEDGTKRRVREEVDVVQLRPIQPREWNEAAVEYFKVEDMVDAWMDGGWWEGTVEKVLVAGRRFKVGFRVRPSILGRVLTKRVVREFDAEDLRIHREWVYGDWVPPLLQEGVQD